MIPVARSYGTPLPSDDLDPAVLVPDYLTALQGDGDGAPASS